MTTKYLSRYVLCSKCDAAKAVNTIRDEQNKLVCVLCEDCTDEYVKYHHVVKGD